MTIRSFHVALVVAGLSGPLAGAIAECKLTRIADLPVTMTGMRPMIAAKINGNDAQFIADSGAFWSSITPAIASDFKLKLHPAPANLKVSGIGGDFEVSVTTVEDVRLANIPIRHIDFIVGGSEPGSGAAGVLGQNVLRMADVEYDLANGIIRLVRPNDCKHAVLAYWANSQPYSVIDIDWSSALQPHTTGSAFVNGVKIRVTFDTGAATSVLSLLAAERAGVHPGGEGVVDAGVGTGFGRRTVRSWVAPFASFKIGDEEIRNTRLRIGETRLMDVDMLIGADFFLSHRVYVASSQRKLYFTYNGGPVFNLASASSRAAAEGPVAKPAAQPAQEGNEPTDAAGFARRGAAFAARRDFGNAIVDLTRACEMDPNEPKYFYLRGLARLQYGQLLPAVADFDQTIKLKPDDVTALVTRARARLAGEDRPGAIADLDAADRIASKDADVRVDIGSGYVGVNLLAQAIAQFDLWIVSHAKDGQLSSTLNERCWARALLGRDLDKALADCNAALRLTPASAQILDSRGLVRLRLGDLNRSITDYDAALKLQPKTAWSLYGRGITKMRKGMITEGQADIAAATSLQPRIVDEARTFGIVP
jgi:tetratricopeptide (TPR) repeat protein/predicted aspartyl protease